MCVMDIVSFTGFDWPSAPTKWQVRDMVDVVLISVVAIGFSLAGKFPGSLSIGPRHANWYFSPDLDAEGWLCPALLKYSVLYAQFKPKAA